MADDDIAKAAAEKTGVKTLPVEIGATGLKRTGGFVQEEFLPELKDDKAIKVFKEMRDNSPIAGALIFAITSLLRQIKWSTKPGTEDKDGIEKAKFLQECMDDMSTSWVDVISEVTSMFPFGWALLEPVYKKRLGYQDETSEVPTSKFNDGRIGWRKMPLRAQETKSKWVFDEKTGGLVAMEQRTDDGTTNKEIPIVRALLFRTQIYKGNPEGRSIFRNAYRPWYFMKRIEEIEAIGIERDLAGLPVMYLPPEYMDPNATEEIKAAYKMYQDMVVNTRRDKQEGMCLPSIYDDSGNQLLKFELMSSGGGRTFDTDSVITRYAQYITMTVLADWLLLGHENVGSFALSTNKSNLFGIALGAWKDNILAVFNDHAVPRLFRMNGFPVENLPTIVAEDIESPDLASIGSIIMALASAGAPPFPNDDLLKRIYQMAGFPEPSDDQLKAMNEAAMAAQQAVEQAGTTAEEDQALNEIAGV